MNSTWSTVFAQFAGQLPTAMVYVIGIVLCALWWRRAPRAAMLAMIGTATLLFTQVGLTFATSYIISNRTGPATATASIMFGVAIVGSILRAAGFGMVLVSVFVERPPVERQSGFEIQSAQQPPSYR